MGQPDTAAERSAGSSAREGSPPPARIRILGQTITYLVARFPALWPLVRAPMRRFFNRLAPEWGQRTTDPQRMKPLEEAVALAAVEPRRALDLGTGTGAAAVWLARHYPDAEIVGADLSPVMIETARTSLPSELHQRVRFVAADATALPFDDGDFDLVVQVSVPAFFAETARVLAPRGVFVAVSSIGTATPCHTPAATLRRGFERHGLEWVGEGVAGRGLYWVLRKPG